METKKFYYEILNPQDAPEPEIDDKGDQVIEEIGNENIKAHYCFINVVVICVLLLFCAFMFFAMRNNDYSHYNDDTNIMTAKSIKSGEYVRNLQTDVYENLSFTEQINSVDNFFGYFYGFNKKAVKEDENLVNDENTNTFDDNTDDTSSVPEQTHIVVTRQTTIENSDSVDGSQQDESTAETKKTTTTKTTTVTSREVSTKMTTESKQKTVTTKQSKTVTTTTNNDAPGATSVTTTAPAETTTEN